MASSFSGLGTATAAYWFQFFLDAGIPPADAGNYAVTFTENRIQQDMIVDLTKEYLHEMGVTVLGDTIAILKHAKRVHTQATREKVLNGSGLSSTTMATGSSSSLLLAPGMARKLSVPTRVSAPVRPSRQSTEPIAELNKASSQTIIKPVVTQARSDSLPKKCESQTKLTAAAAAKDVQAPAKKKLQKLQDALEILPTTTPVKGSVVRLKPKIVHEVPVPKVRNVTQEQEGGYKIIFPSGMIKKTKVTAIQPKKTSTIAKAGAKQSSSVFDRLGQEQIADKAVASGHLLVAGGTGQVETTNSGKATKGSTVFCRLGEKRELKRPGTENDVDNIDTKKKAKITVEDRLGPAKATVAPSKSAGILSHNTMPDTRPVHLRLGNKHVLPAGVGEEDHSTATDACPLNSGRMKTRSDLGAPANVTPWSDPTGRMAARCQRVSFKSDAFASNTGLTKMVEPQQKLKDDLVIRVESQNSGGATVRRIGSQKLTGGAAQPTLTRSGNVMNRLGSKRSEGHQAVQPDDKSGNVMFRLGSRRSSEDQLVQLKPRNPVQVTVRIGSLKMMTSTAEDASWTVPAAAASKTGVFSRLGNRTSSTAV